MKKRKIKVIEMEVSRHVTSYLKCLPVGNPTDSPRTLKTEWSLNPEV